MFDLAKSVIDAASTAAKKQLPKNQISSSHTHRTHGVCGLSVASSEIVASPQRHYQPISQDSKPTSRRSSIAPLCKCNQSPSPARMEQPPATPPSQRSASPPLGAETLSALQRSRASPPLPPLPPLPPRCGSSGYAAPIPVSIRPRCRARTGQRDAASPVGVRAI